LRPEQASRSERLPRSGRPRARARWRVVAFGRRAGPIPSRASLFMLASTVYEGWALFTFFSNIHLIFQFFNYLPNVFKHENTKHLLIEVQNFRNLVEHYFKWNKLPFCPNFQISIDFEL
jgi:hypothetical protein